MDTQYYLEQSRRLFEATIHSTHSIVVKADEGDGYISQSPFVPTAFIYMWTFFNSLYNVDWKESRGLIRYHHTHGRHAPSERERIKIFVEHLFETPMSKQCNKILVDGFFPQCANRAEALDRLVNGICSDYNWMGAFYGDRANVIPTVREKIKAAYRERAINAKDLVTILDFIYSVRCNIFHGVKTMDLMIEDSQSARLKLYTHIVQSVCECFLPPRR